MEHKEMRFTFSSLCATGKMLSTCKDCIEKTPARLPFGGHSHVLPQANGAEFQISSYLCLARHR
ncbi:hypothetical protein [Prevotella conceptionensis]|uniref:hypothetical protein n=1 Tax=Prevotella conceptionensis TaxID=340486 RepID=UPI0012FAB835|nr:hypothetical protein [Prevotella conceptionensis]